MNPIEFSRRLFATEPASPESAALAGDLVDEARYLGRLALQRYFSATDPGDQQKGRNVLDELGLLALAPLAETGPLPNVSDEVWVIRTMGEEFLGVRRRVVGLLAELLASRRVAPSPSGAEAAAPRGARICDLAFLLLHRMLHLAPAAGFLDLTPAERDQRIREFRDGPALRSVFEDQQ